MFKVRLRNTGPERAEVLVEVANKYYIRFWLSVAV